LIERIAVLCIIAVAAAEAQTPGVDSKNWQAMTAAPCAWSVPVQKKDGRLDIDRTIALLKEAGFSCEIAVIAKDAPRTWDEFKKLAAAANAAGIDLWPVILPPSEGSSPPFGHDYPAWAEAIAKLSLQFPHVRGFNIDDLHSGISTKTFTRDYVCRIYGAKQKTNANLLFVPTIYDLDKGVADQLAGCVDGVWLWWVNLEMATGQRSFLENTRLAVSGRFPVYGGVYAHWTSWHKQGNPVPGVFKRSLENSCRYSDGAMIWNISLEGSDPLFQIAKTFLPGGSAALAGKCGQSTGSK
jgi:hypothetical protein